MKTTFKKTQVTKGVIFKKIPDIRCWFFINKQVERQVTKKIVLKKKINHISIQNKTVNTLISFAVATDFGFRNKSFHEL